jgi:hypothetical protein
VDSVPVTEPAFTGGTMAWLDEVEDALLLINYEESHGHVAGSGDAATGDGRRHS